MNEVPGRPGGPAGPVGPLGPGGPRGPGGPGGPTRNVGLSSSGGGSASKVLKWNNDRTGVTDLQNDGVRLYSNFSHLKIDRLLKYVISSNVFSMDLK